MAAQNETPLLKAAREAGRTIVSESPKFDLDSYIANYKGKAKIERLFHIGRTSPFLSSEAISLGVAETKEGKDVELYEQITALISNIDPKNPLAELDQAWVKRTTAEVNEESKRLEAELKGYKNNLIKESIRMGYDEAGRHYQDIGSLKDAEKAFHKEREYCQTPSHVAVMTFRLIALFLDRKVWISVEANALKLRDVLLSSPDSPAQSGLISAIVGLAQLSSRDYAHAAASFIDTNVAFLQGKPSGEMTDDPAGLRGVITPNDVATYGALCALASMDRTQLQTRALENPSFRQFLELEPHLRRAISFFVSGKFSQCLGILESYRADYLLDINLYPHFGELFDRIRSKAIVQYFIPFSRVTFAALAEAFNTEERTIQNSLVDLIKSDQLAGRLDLVKGLLIANTADQRRQAHQEALQSARDFERTLHQRILRMEAIAAGLEVRATPVAPGGNSASGDILMGADDARGGRASRQRVAAGR